MGVSCLGALRCRSARPNQDQGKSLISLQNMITRYQDPTIESIWDEPSTYYRWLRIENIWNEYMFGIPLRCPTPDSIRNPRGFLASLIRRSKDLEKTLRHDVGAFVKALEEKTKCRYVHFGLTSSDVVDTALMMGLKYSCTHIGTLLHKASDSVSKLNSGSFKVPTRTHGVIAEAIPLPAMIERFEAELQYLAGRMFSLTFYGKLSGSVGLHQGCSNPEIQKKMKDSEGRALTHLGLNTCQFPTQVIPRELFSDIIYQCSVASATMSRMATQFRLFISHGEVTRNVGNSTMGSSSMPHKVNPIGFEKICGLNRLISANLQVSLDNTQLWAERDISNSAPERVIIPDTMHALAHQVTTLIEEFNKWSFNKAACAKSLRGVKTDSQAKMSDLILGGLSREEAYQAIKGTFKK